MRRLLFLFGMCWSLGAAPPAFVKEGHGPSILFIHGFGGNRDVWKEAAAALAKDYTVVRVDLPGSGGTAGPPEKDGGADLEAIAKNLVALVRQERLSPCLVVGHSMGGPIAILAALQDPHCFRGVVLVDSSLSPAPPAFVASTRAGLNEDPKATLEDFFDAVTRSRAQRDRVVTEALRIPVPVLISYLLGRTRNPAQGREASLALPILHLRSGDPEKDPAQAEAREARSGCKGFPDYRVVHVSNASHWPMWDQPERFLNELRAFDRGQKRANED